jgi:hypothetical protein
MLLWTIWIMWRQNPLINSWFDAARILEREGDDWLGFGRRLAGVFGILARP